MLVLSFLVFLFVCLFVFKKLSENIGGKMSEFKMRSQNMPFCPKGSAHMLSLHCGSSLQWKRVNAENDWFFCLINYSND